MNTPRVFKKPAVASDNFLRARLHLVQRRLEAEFQTHVSTRQANFDSGLPLEDAFRSEFAELLRPFAVDVGRIVDRNGDTSGECDVVILEPRLSPLLLGASSPISRKKWFTYESTYGIAEVKQTLTLGALDQAGTLVEDPSGTLWDACTKIFAYKQLCRAEPPSLHLESNAPIGIVVCYSCDLDVQSEGAQDAILKEFLAVNSLVAPQHRVDAIYLLNKGIFTWSFLTDPVQRIFATLQHPHESPTLPWASFHPTGIDTLYAMFLQVWDVLMRTKLHHPDLLRYYGGRSLIGRDIRTMTTSIDEKRRLDPPK